MSIEKLEKKKYTVKKKNWGIVDLQAHLHLTPALATLLAVQTWTSQLNFPNHLHSWNESFSFFFDERDTVMHSKKYTFGFCTVSGTELLKHSEFPGMREQAQCFL